MGESRRLELPKVDGYQTSGIQIEYIKSRDVLYISGYYDSCVGIQGTELPFAEFCKRLDIDLSRKRGNNR